MPKVAATTQAIAAALTALRQSTVTAAGKSAVDEATAAMGEFAAVDKRARDYVHSGQLLMAGDGIFPEGGQPGTVAAPQVETARQAEHQAFDAAQSEVRQRQAEAIGAAGAFAALMTLVLAGTGGGRSAEQAEPATAFALSRTAPVADDGIVSHARPVAAAPRPAAPVPP